jgi:hypothetical protein
MTACKANLFIKRMMSMDGDIRTIQAAFYNTANDILQVTYQQFRRDAAGIDRNGDENVYQLLRSKYIRVLRQLLEQKAGIFCDRCKIQKLQQPLRARLTDTIRYFEAEFMRKANEA